MMDNTIERRTNNLTQVETMFDARRTPWDGLGKRIAGAVTSRDAIRLAGLDWNVVPTDIISEATGLKIPGYKANVRDIDNKTLGIVTERYKIVQNEEAFSFTDALLGEGVRYETAGALQSGKKVWMLARLEGRMITDEKIDPFLVFTNSHDGKGSVRVAITPVRVWCQNTLNLALKEAERQWVCKHTGRIDEKLVEAKYTLMNTEHYLEALEAEFGKMKMKKLDVDKVHKFVKMLLPISEKDGDRKVANVQEMRNELMMRYLNAPDLQVLEPSAYRFVNAVSDFSTHRKPSRGSEYYQENMFMKVVDGDELIDKAYAICDAEV